MASRDKTPCLSRGLPHHAEPAAGDAPRKSGSGLLWTPQQDSIVLWALERSRGTGADGKPLQPRASIGLSTALLAEFPELHAPVHSVGGIAAKMWRMVPTLLDERFILPACDLPDCDARIDRAVAAAGTGRAVRRGVAGTGRAVRRGAASSEDPSASDDSWSSQGSGEDSEDHQVTWECRNAGRQACRRPIRGQWFDELFRA